MLADGPGQSRLDMKNGHTIESDILCGIISQEEP